jgi:hypothetical protein
MSSKETINDHTQDVTGHTNDPAVSRRNILLGTSTLVAVAALTSDALAQNQKAAQISALTRTD